MPSSIPENKSPEVSIPEAIDYLTWVADLVIRDPEGLILVDDDRLSECANVLAEYRANTF